MLGKDGVEVEHGFHFGRGKDPTTPVNANSSFLIAQSSQQQVWNPNRERNLL